MKNRIYLLFSLFLLTAQGLIAQPSEKMTADWQLGADFMSRYIWRGLDLGGPAPSIQPSAKVTLGNPKHQFALGAWGAYTFSPTANQELDLTLGYTYKGVVTVSVTDYFFPGLNTGVKDDYFRYNSDSTGHVFEGALMFNGTAKIPFTFLAAVNFYGNDARRMKKVNDSTFTEDGIQYSTYLELGYKQQIKGVDMTLFAGGTITNPDEAMQETGYYLNTKAGLTNVGIKLAKGIRITESYILPVQASLIANPLQNRLFMVFGFTL
jgi:hypothetical protein